MRSFHPIFYASLIVLAVSNAGCDIGIKILQKVATAVQEVEVKETPLEYHQRRMREVDGPGWTDLHRAAAKGDVATVQKLLDLGVPVDVREHKGGTPLYEATRRGQLDVMKLLLKNGADVDDAGQEGLCTPLCLAAEYNQVEAARLLLKHGADINHQTTFGNTPLHMASMQTWHGDSEIVQLLIEEGKADMNLLSYSGCYALYCAVNKNHTPAALYLLSKGADANYMHPGGTSTLYAAVFRQNYKVTKALLDKGANPNALFKNRNTPLQRTVLNNDLVITRLLLQYKADPNLIHGDTKPPLYSALLGHKKELIRVLLEHGADPMLKVRDHTIYDYAVFQNDQEVLGLITQQRLKSIKEQRKKKKAA